MCDKNKKRRGRLFLALAVAPFLPLLLLVSVPWVLFGVYRSTDEYKERKASKRDEKNATPPKVKPRKRALSISENLAKDKRVKDQQQSKLWLLPAELRLQIYEEVIGRREDIHVAYIKGVLHAYRCRKSRDQPLHNECWCHCRDSPSSTRDQLKRKMNVLGLMQSCRVIYSESIGLLYSLPTFLFNDYNAFVAFTSAVLPQRFNAVQSIHLYQDTGNFGCEQNQNTLFMGLNNYCGLHAHDFKSLNPVLPKLKAPNLPGQTEGRVWHQVLVISRLLPALRNLRVTIALAMTSSEYYDHEQLKLASVCDRGIGMRKYVAERLWTPSTLDEWKDFDFSTDIAVVGRFWNAVWELKKKGVTAVRAE